MCYSKAEILDEPLEKIRQADAEDNLMSVTRLFINPRDE
jgi:hypothetical protein